MRRVPLYTQNERYKHVRAKWSIDTYPTNDRLLTIEPESTAILEDCNARQRTEMKVLPEGREEWHCLVNTELEICSVPCFTERSQNTCTYMYYKHL